MAGADPLTFDDHYKLLEANRTRVRALGTIVGTTCGFLLTASSAILGFVYKGDTVNIPAGVRVALWLAIGIAALALGLVVAAFQLKTPEGAADRSALLGALTKIYSGEHERIRLALFALMGALLVLAIGMIWFAVVAEPKVVAPMPRAWFSAPVLRTDHARSSTSAQAKNSAIPARPIAKSSLDCLAIWSRIATASASASSSWPSSRLTPTTRALQ